jgi:haloalkane dehalogenase
MATQPESDVSSAMPFTLQFVNVHGSRKAYVDTTNAFGLPTTAVFLHGNPISSYKWRNIIPHIATQQRCVAPDLIGMGRSDKPDSAYRFVDHARYLHAFFDAVVPTGNVLLVVQDWGSALGLHWASRNPGRVAGIALMEFIRPFETWNDVGAEGPAQDMFKAFRTPDLGRKLLIDENAFLTIILPGRKLSPVEQAYYDAPFPDAKSREPVYRWPNELPIEGFPEDVHKLVVRYHEWLLQSEVPKLLFWATPGALLSEAHVEWYKQNLRRTEVFSPGYNP